MSTFRSVFPEIVLCVFIAVNGRPGEAADPLPSVIDGDRRSVSRQTQVVLRPFFKP